MCLTREYLKNKHFHSGQNQGIFDLVVKRTVAQYTPAQLFLFD